MSASLHRFIPVGLLAMCSIGLLWAGCGSSAGDSGRPTNGRTGGANGTHDASDDGYVINPDATSGGGTDAGAPPNPLCGIQLGGDGRIQGCTPDREDSCNGYVPPGVGGQSGTAGAAGSAHAGTPSGVGGDAPSIAPPGGAGGLDNIGGASGASGSGSAVAYSCQVLETAEGMRAECAEAGNGDENAPCLSSRDCRAGLGCVGEAAAGLCLPFCCAGETRCKKGYCAERPLRDESRPSTEGVKDAGAPVMVPVCAPADDCRLSEPYPCPAGVKCTCSEGTACLAVGADTPTTTCTKPGTGVAGEACPCAWNHVCSRATNKCVQLCQTAVGRTDCAGSECQASAELPDGWGVCVGAGDAG